MLVVDQKAQFNSQDEQLEKHLSSTLAPVYKEIVMVQDNVGKLMTCIIVPVICYSKTLKKTSKLTIKFQQSRLYEYHLYPYVR